MKKKIIRILLCIVMLLTFNFTSVFAHPGRTDKNGCHTCRTNCAKWGLRTGEYHCHNSWGSSSGGSTSSGTSGSSGSSNSPSVAPKTTTPSVDYAAKGKAEGYAYKKANPDASLPDLSGQTDAYVNSYKESFNAACSELTTESESQAIARATSDATNTEEMNLSTDGLQVISSVYQQKYKEIYQQEEKNYFKGIEDEAKNKARLSVWNKEKKNDSSSYPLQKAITYYQSEYDKYYDEEKSNLEEVREIIQEKAQTDAKDGKEKRYKSIDFYKDYKIYTSLKKAYDEAYDEEINHAEITPVDGIAGATAVAGIGYLGYRKYKKKRA